MRQSIHTVLIATLAGLSAAACGDDGTKKSSDTLSVNDVAADSAGPDGMTADSDGTDTDADVAVGDADTADVGPDVIVDPCGGPCNSPPSAVCDGAQLVTSAAVGTCVEAACVYTTTSTTCALGCDAGACVGDPCANVNCDTPPDDCHAAVGTCASGACSYAALDAVSCDDGDACTTSDGCSAGVCAGEAVSCQSPPLPVCLDGDRLEVPAAAGVCGAEGACDYTTTIVTCDGGCADGACRADPCANVVCDSPPNGCYEAAGTCANGVCSYSPDNGASCDDGNACTTNDRCNAGVCGGSALVCQSPPNGPTCANANTLRSPVVPGACAVGQCQYATSDVACAFGCEAGACLGDPCSGVSCNTPPAPVCVGSVLRTASAAGTCQGGGCNYATTDVTCANGCANAACKAPVGLVISEIMYDSTGYPDTDAFVEIHGPAGTNLSGVSLVGVNGNGGADYATVRLNGVIGSDGLFVVAHSAAQAFIADVADMTSNSVDFQNGPDSVQLRFGATVLDAVAYGTFAAGNVFAGEGAAHPATNVNESLFRDSAFTDTQNNLVDFATDVPSPGAPTPVPVPLVAALNGPSSAVLVDVAVTFDASGSTGRIVSYSFDFGDGSAAVVGTAASVMHTFAAAGTYTVTVTIADAGGAQSTASVTTSVVVPGPTSPFDPGSCGGTPLTEATAMTLLNGATSMVLGSRIMQVRTRSCTVEADCPAWSTPQNHSISYLTYSGGVTTRYSTLLTDTRLILYLKNGVPRYSVRHSTSFSKYPTDHDKGLTFAMSPAKINYPTMKAYNYAPVGQYDYRDLEAYINRTAYLEVGEGCARFISISPGDGNPTNATTSEVVGLFVY